MRVRRAWITSVFLYGLSLWAQDLDLRVNLHLEDAGFEEYVRSVEVQTGLNFCYNQNWVEKLELTIHADSL
jgi:hypothetical protein